MLLASVLAPLPPRDLARLCACSRALLAFAGASDLWRAHVLQDVVEGAAAADATGAAATSCLPNTEMMRLRWCGGWQETYAAAAAAATAAAAAAAASASQPPPQPQTAEAEPTAAAEPTPSSPARKRPRATRDRAARPPPAPPLPVLYSDLLHASRRCAGPLARLPRRWLERENVERAPAGLTRAEFVARYERPNLPVILTDVVGGWPAFGGGGAGREGEQGRSGGGERRGGGGKQEQAGTAAAATVPAASAQAAAAAAPPAPWSSLSALLERTPLGASGSPVVVGNQEWDLAQYVAYARDNDDEMPLYLFDKHFCDKAPAMAEQYSSPRRVFGDDLFALLPAGCRPDWRWLIAGPARSGSTFHVDPNATSAWNAVVSGSKRWVMFPPGGAPPPGVHPSADGAEVAAPVSILEWYWAFYEAAREEEEEDQGDGGVGGAAAWALGGQEEEEAEEEEDEEAGEGERGTTGAALAGGRRGRRREPRPWRPARRMYECTARAGEVLFVPRGWWHMALNLEEGVAVTHNFVSEVNLPYVLRFLRGAAEAAAAEAKEAAAGAVDGGGGKSGGGGGGGASKRHASLAQDLVSGVGLGGRALLYDRFVAALREHAPEALAQAQARVEEEEAEARARRRLAAAFAPPPPLPPPPPVASGADADDGKWPAAKAAAPNGGAFAFSFF